MKKRVKKHSILVAREQENKHSRREFDKMVSEFNNKIVVSKYWPSSRKPPMGWSYQGTVARGKAYRQLRKVDPHFMSYAGRAEK